MAKEVKINERLLKEHPYNKEFLNEPFHKKTNLLIIGAGMGGRLVLREVNRKKQHEVVGFVDDNPELIGDQVQGIKVYGPIKNLPEIFDKLKSKQKEIDEVMIAMPSAEGPKIREITNLVFQKVSKISILPTAYEDPFSIKTGLVVPKKIREVKIEDFFRRKPILLPFDEMVSHYKGKKILVTGAGGSIGSELVRQLLMFSPEHLILFDSSEFSLYSIQMELSQDETKKTFLLGDLKDKEKIGKVISKFKPEIIFHAAAYKHVPLLEENPEESINNNVKGFCNLMKSLDDNVKEFILISTDKAVDPSSIMGMSKRICELILQSKSKKINSKLLAVRFGNVACSSGSVIPLFEKQVENGGPLTVTDAKMKRFFMTIPEAAQLVLQTPILGETGDILVLDMGEQYSLFELAKDVITIHGFVPQKDIKIKIVGTRKGEKIEEKLFGNKEKISKTRNERISVIKTNQIEENKIVEFLAKIFSLSKQFDKTEIKNVLLEEFRKFNIS
jgi:FlaA1/EpsC-like NDP-sugar epimerase